MSTSAWGFDFVDLPYALQRLRMPPNHDDPFEDQGYDMQDIASNRPVSLDDCIDYEYRLLTVTFSIITFQNRSMIVNTS